METNLRNTLRLAVTACRRMLEEDYYLQLEGKYLIITGKQPNPETVPGLSAAANAERKAILSAIQHEMKKGVNYDFALSKFVRESAFTTLNRFAALKLMEHPSRKLIPESIGGRDGSKGFKQFQMVSPEAIRHMTDGGYRFYLELQFDDLSNALGVLFDRSLPHSILFPSPTCLSGVLDTLNQPDLEPVWGEDETIGWIYQYFTPAELRDQVRKESSAPRDSYELAFRNQFYTPRYVVAFLAENTLGRTWYEMRNGETQLIEQCEYLVRPPGESIESRAKKDPRDLRILDPACGSGHFLLYCFDLLLTIYKEAYEDPDLGPELKQAYPTQDRFQSEVPRLILEHNLHGVDIDRRATQIAALALWLRAQRAYREMGIAPRNRPRIRRSNIVCAEQMPGEYDLLGEFLRDLKPAVIGELARKIWEHMEGVDEIGSLLKIEQVMKAELEKAYQAWASVPPPVQLTLFGPNQPTVQMILGFSDITEEEFWDQAADRVLETLNEYTEQVTTSSGTLRKLFAYDAAQGIAFVDLFQKPFDVVLMNPPFGAPSLGSKDYVVENYPRTKNDLYAAFVERGLDLLHPGGYLGAITSRTGFFLKSFQQWREEILLKEAQFITMADLGYGVLDTAMVETAAYVVKKKTA